MIGARREGLGARRRKEPGSRGGEGGPEGAAASSRSRTSARSSRPPDPPDASDAGTRGALGARSGSGCEGAPESSSASSGPGMAMRGHETRVAPEKDEEQAGVAGVRADTRNRGLSLVGEK